MTINIFFNRHFAGQKRMGWHIQSTERNKLSTIYSTEQSCPSDLRRKKFSRETKAEGVHDHIPALKEMLKGFLQAETKEC